MDVISRSNVHAALGRLDRFYENIELCRIATKDGKPILEYMPKPQNWVGVLIDALQQFCKRHPEIQWSEIISVDGLLMAESLPSGSDSDDIPWVQEVTLVSMGQVLLNAFEKGRLEVAIIYGH